MYSLTFKWTVSRGQDTYGYNICSLWVDRIKVSSCNGGGYDMQGTAFAEWFQKAFQKELCTKVSYHAKAFYECTAKGKFMTRLDDPPKGWTGRTKLYGVSAWLYKDGEAWKIHHVSMDGGCGFESMKRIAEALGFGLQFVSESGRNTAYIMADKAAVEALHGIKG